MDERAVLVLHVKKGYEDREKHIEQMMRNHHLPYIFILDGDIPDLTEELVNQYFTGDTMRVIGPQSSCAMKHLLACQYILNHDLKGALILEDDMVLYENFNRVYEESLLEMEKRKLKNALISFEDSSLHFVPRSERKRGQHLYAHDRDRFAGAYYCSREAAQLILNYVEKHKCDLPIDCFHKALIQRAGLLYLWCHPCIATQGTHTGLFVSSISQKSAKRQKYRQRTWKLKLAYKKALSFFR